MYFTSKISINNYQYAVLMCRGHQMLCQHFVPRAFGLLSFLEVFRGVTSPEVKQIFGSLDVFLRIFMTSQWDLDTSSFHVLGMCYIPIAMLCFSLYRSLLVGLESVPCNIRNPWEPWEMRLLWPCWVMEGTNCLLHDFHQWFWDKRKRYTLED